MDVREVSFDEERPHMVRELIVLREYTDVKVADMWTLSVRTDEKKAEILHALDIDIFL